MNRSLAWVIWAAVAGAILLLAAPWSPTSDEKAEPVEVLSDDQRETLASLEKLSDYPLYSMTYVGDYVDRSVGRATGGEDQPAWACALVSSGGPDGPLMGRNFDWPRHPALLLFTDAPGAYATVSMVDLSYLIDPDDADNLVEWPIDARRALLSSPHWPFDGMNERGLAVAMAAVQDTEMPRYEGARTVSSLGIIRQWLDYAATVEEALAMLSDVNIDMTGGPTLHYMIADATGDAALVEFWQQETIITRASDKALFATNYLVSQVPEEARAGLCARYDGIADRLAEVDGTVDTPGMMAILAAVRQEIPEYPEFGTQWSIVYQLAERSMHLVIERAYDVVQRFDLAELDR